MTDDSEFEVLLAEPFGQALEMVEAALKVEAFEVVTRFDVQRTMMDKLHVALRPYVILGACNNRIAEQILKSDPCVALTMPCNISVEVTADEQTLVRVADPAQLVSCKCNEDPLVLDIADDASRRLTQVIRTLRSNTRPNDPNSKTWKRLSSEVND